jgi:putative acetyltransferase
MVTQASITARPFFEDQGFRVVKRNGIERAGVELTNFTMAKRLA